MDQLTRIRCAPTLVGDICQPPFGHATPERQFSETPGDAAPDLPVVAQRLHRWDEHALPFEMDPDIPPGSSTPLLTASPVPSPASSPRLSPPRAPARRRSRPFVPAELPPDSPIIPPGRLVGRRETILPPEMMQTTLLAPPPPVQSIFSHKQNPPRTREMDQAQAWPEPAPARATILATINTDAPATPPISIPKNMW